MDTTSPKTKISTIPNLGLNALTGVFLPYFLSITGVILFLRLGWIIGAGGIFLTLEIIALSSLIILITAFSISSTITNRKIGDGGVYFLLSRTFGLEAGTAISLPLYFSQTIGVAFYICGFTEVLSPFFPHIPPALIAAITLSTLTILALYSTSLALRLQWIILFLFLLSLASIILGKKQVSFSEASSIQSFPFWTLFPLFFPAVTGIEIGLGISKELKNPRFAIPAGTIGAILVGILIYTFLSIFLAFTIPREVLSVKPHILHEIARIKEIVLLGIWGATLSSALSCIISAPRTLQALAEDRIIPKKIQNPKAAILCTSLITLIAILFGSLNSIAPILTMFFLLSYGMLNLATGLESFFENPSWRPTFRLNPLVSLFGFALCLICMLMINVTSTLCALLFTVAIYAFLKRRSVQTNWDDLRHSILLFLSRFAIYRLSSVKKGPKSWRPNLLTFVGDPILRAHLVQFTQNVTHGKGFLSMASIYPSFAMKHEMDFASYKEKMQRFFEHMEAPAIFEIKSAPTVVDGMKTFIKNYGIGGLTPNTIVLGATTKKDQFRVYAEAIMLAHKLQKNVIIIRESTSHGLHKQKQIDVWWGGHNRRNSDLMLVLAYMLQTSKEWKGSNIQLKTIVPKEKYQQTMLQKIQEFTTLGRLHISPEVIISKEGENAFEHTIPNVSKGSDLVFLGMRPPTTDETVTEYSTYYANLLKNTENYPPIAFVLAGEPIHFGQILE